jgi:myo-inositol-1(or 4)-monophosphatase
VATRRGSQDWDIAAAALILDECGVHIADVCTGFPQFNKRDVRHGALAALGDMSLKPHVHAALIKVYGCPAETSAAEPSIPSHTDLTDG